MLIECRAHVSNVSVTVTATRPEWSPEAWVPSPNQWAGLAELSGGKRAASGRHASLGSWVAVWGGTNSNGKSNFLCASDRAHVGPTRVRLLIPFNLFKSCEECVKCSIIHIRKARFGNLGNMKSHNPEWTGKPTLTLALIVTVNMPQAQSKGFKNSVSI